MTRTQWVAAGLSVLQPGIGQLYNGEWRKALLFAAGTWVLGVTLAVLFLVLATSWWVIVLLIAIALGALAVVVVDAARTAGRHEGDRPWRWYNRWFVCLFLLGVALSVVQPAMADWMRGRVVDAFRIPTTSMAPALLEGDYVLFGKLGSSETRRGQVVEFTWPDRPDVRYVKRVVAIGGDTVSMTDGVLSLDGTVDSTSYARSHDSWGPFAVPVGSVFVLGEDLENSEDSRGLGFLPEDRIQSRRGRVYLSIDPQSGRWRLDRIGLAIR